MVFGNLFMSQADKELAEKLKVRQAFRGADKALQRVNTEVSRMCSERDKLWKQAKAYKMDGQTMAAKRALQSFRAQELHIANLQMKGWGFEQIMLKMKLAEIDTAFAKALGGLGKVPLTGSNMLESTLDQLGMKMDDFADTNNIWANLYTEEMSKVDADPENNIPSLDELDSFLTEEAAAEVNSSHAETVQEPTSVGRMHVSTDVPRTDAPRTALDKKIDFAQERLKKMKGEK